MGDTSAFGSQDLSNETLGRIVEGTHFQQAFDQVDYIAGKQTLQSPPSSGDCETDPNSGHSRESPPFKNPPEFFTQNIEAYDIYTERFVQNEKGVERFFNNKLVNQPSFSDRNNEI
jgi:hypothetical protein